jgi:hypothetical protein
MNVPAKLPNARSVRRSGSPVTDSSPMTTNARPRNSATCPIVPRARQAEAASRAVPLNAAAERPDYECRSGMISLDGQACGSRGTPSTRSDSADTWTRPTGRLGRDDSTSGQGSDTARSSGQVERPVVNESCGRGTPEATERCRSSTGRSAGREQRSPSAPTERAQSRSVSVRARGARGRGSRRLSLHGARSSGAGRPRRAGRGSGRTRSRSAAARRSRPAARTPRRAATISDEVIVWSSSAPSAAP